MVFIQFSINNYFNFVNLADNLRKKMNIFRVIMVSSGGGPLLQRGVRHGGLMDFVLKVIVSLRMDSD